MTEHLLRDFVIVAYPEFVGQILSRFMACCLEISTTIVLENFSLDFQNFSWSTARKLTQALTHLTCIWEVRSSNLGDENGCPY